MNAIQSRVKWVSIGAALMGLGMLAQASQAAQVAYITFDNADTTITGDGTGDGLGGGNPSGTPFNITIADQSGNGNNAVNDSTQLSQTFSPPWPVSPAVYGAQMITGEPGKVGESHRFTNDPSVFNRASNNATYYVEPGVVPDGADERTFSLWFRQHADIQPPYGNSQDKLFGYGTGASGEAFDVSLESGGIRIRHFGGNVTWGSGYEFYEANGDGSANLGKDAGWHHLAVRVNTGAVDFTDVDIFVDAVKLSITAESAPGAKNVILNTVEQDTSGAGVPGFPGHGFGIGDTSIVDPFLAAQNGFDGWIDEFRIFDTALTDQLISDLYNLIPIDVLEGDLNGDGFVGLDDLDIILNNWNQTVTVGDPLQGDISGAGGTPDGYVGLDDLDVLLNHWNEGTPPPTNAIPEPASLMLLSMGALALMRRQA